MNKKLITLAVTAALVAPAAAMADATLYGKLNVSIDYFDIQQTDAQKALGVNTYKGWTLNKGQVGEGAGRANRIGVKGSEDLGGGLKAIYQVEFGIDLANESDYNIANGDRGSVSMRNTFVGLAGGFGTFLVGRHDTPLKISTGKLDLFADTMADYNGTVGFNDVRADNAIAYISPSFSGFQFAGAIVPGSASTASGTVIGLDVTLAGATENNDSDSIAQAYSLAGIYTNGPFYASVAYESFGKDLLGLNVPGTSAVVYSTDDFNKWRVGLGILDWNGFTFDGVWENQDAGDLSANLYQLQAAYAFGNNSIKAMYGWVDRDINLQDKDLSDLLNGSRDTWAIGFDHNFSKRTRAYVLYTDVNDDAADMNDWSGFSVGMVHSF